MQYLKHSYDQFSILLQQSDFMKGFLPLILGCLASLGFMPFLQLIIHEAGHGIFGILSGYRFISFRIFRYTLIKQDNCFRIKKYTYPGSAGQCIMSPISLHTKTSEIVLYLMGGVIANLIFASCFLLVAVSSFSISFPVRVILLIGSFYGMGFALMNGIPIPLEHILNDGSVLYSVIRNKQALHSMLVQQMVLPLLQEGLTYKDISEEFMKVADGADLSNEMICWHKLLEAYYYMDLRQFPLAKGCIEALHAVREKITKPQRTVIEIERLFLSILMDEKPVEIKELFLKTRRLLYNKKADFHITRVRMAYEIYSGASAFSNNKLRKEIEDIRKTYPYKGEAKFCSHLIYDYMNKKGGYGGDKRTSESDPWMQQADT